MSSSQAYVRFRTALADRDLAAALTAARAMPGHLSLLDALELTLLAAESGAADVFEGCAARWLARVTVERDLTLARLMQAGAVLEAAGRGEAPHAHRALAELL